MEEVYGPVDNNESINKPKEDEVEEIQLTGCGASICCDPRRNVHRFFVLIFMCFLSFGKCLFLVKKKSIVKVYKSELKIFKNRLSLLRV